MFLGIGLMPDGMAYDLVILFPGDYHRRIFFKQSRVYGIFKTAPGQAQGIVVSFELA